MNQETTPGSDAPDAAPRELTRKEMFLGLIHSFQAAAMQQMAALRPPVDAFFDGVKVNADDKQVRENRLNLLASLRATLHQVADFGRIEG